MKNVSRVNMNQEQLINDDRCLTEILKVLERLSTGYAKRDIEHVDTYVEELFIKQPSLYILGTSSNELCTGTNGVKDLLESDWKYWGDTEFQLDKARINVDDYTAWFSIPGTVKYSFKHSAERYKSYVKFAREKAEDKNMTQLQRLGFINWIMALTYHQRDCGERDYYHPMVLSGVMVKENNVWKISQGHFSLAKSIFPDERMESEQDFRVNNNKDKEAFANHNEMVISEDIEELLNQFKDHCFGKEEIDVSYINQYFSNDSYIISTDMLCAVGRKEIKQLLQQSSHFSLILDNDAMIINKIGRQTSITGMAKMIHKSSQEELANKAVSAMAPIFESDETDKEKLFDIHRQVAYALKECAYGDTYTYPIRYSMILTEYHNEVKINSIHFSYPYYWILEGK